MNTDDLIPLMEGFTEAEEAKFDAGWCEAVGIPGGIEIDEIPSIEECERIYRLTGTLRVSGIGNTALL
jgi:hypothetical protein